MKYFILALVVLLAFSLCAFMTPETVCTCDPICLIGDAFYFEDEGEGGVWWETYVWTETATHGYDCYTISAVLSWQKWDTSAEPPQWVGIDTGMPSPMTEEGFSIQYEGWETWVPAEAQQEGWGRCQINATGGCYTCYKKDNDQRYVLKNP
jgi:hypothetical protein